MNDLIEQYLKEKYGEDYMAKAKEKQDAALSGARWGELGADIGSVIAGRAPGESSQYFKNIRDESQKPMDKYTAEQKALVDQYLKSKYYDTIVSLKEKDIAAKQSKTAPLPKTEPTGPKPVKMTPAQIQVDKSFAKTYENWEGQGGFANVEKQLSQLDDAIAKLKQDPNLVGKVQGIMPPSGKRIFMPQSTALQQQVEQAVQNTLRQTLGAQFTEKEGERIMRNSFDPALSAEENIKKISAAAEQLRKQAQATNSAAKYYEEHGSLVGYKPATQKSESKQVVKKMYSPSADKTKVIYADGSSEVLNGKQ